MNWQKNRPPTPKVSRVAPGKPPSAKKPRKALRPQSEKKAVWTRRYSDALADSKARQIECNGSTWCNRCGKNGPVQGHHTQGRIGENILVFVLLCHVCHAHIHANGKESRADGWLK